MEDFKEKMDEALQELNFDEVLKTIEYLLYQALEVTFSGEWFQYLFAAIGVFVIGGTVVAIVLWFSQIVNGLIVLAIGLLAAWCTVELTLLGIEWYISLIICAIVAGLLSIPFLYAIAASATVRKEIFE